MDSAVQSGSSDCSTGTYTSDAFGDHQSSDYLKGYKIDTIRQLMASTKVSATKRTELPYIQF